MKKLFDNDSSVSTIFDLLNGFSQLDLSLSNTIEAFGKFIPISDFAWGEVSGLQDVLNFLTIFFNWITTPFVILYSLVCDIVNTILSILNAISAFLGFDPFIGKIVVG